VKTTKRDTGIAAESLAGDYLHRAGLVLVARNYRSPFGEIDLVMREGNTLVFVEVRYRQSSRFGTPAETVTAPKRAKIRATAEHFLQQRREWAQSPCRFDILAIEGNDPLRVDWLQNAF